MRTVLTNTLPNKRRIMRLASILLAPVMAAALIALPNQADAKVKDTTKVVATWIAPATGSILTAPATIVLSVDAEAKQANQPIVSVEFFNGATLIGSRTTASSGLNYQVSWPNVSPGTYSLTATATNDKGDFDTTDPVTITVIKANQSISGFSPPTPITYAPNASFTLAATGGASGNLVSFASATSATCSVSGSTVMIQSAGTCTITADQAGDINYNPAPQVASSVTINRANQAITGFNPAMSITYAPGAIFTLSAMGGVSGNPVSFASVTPTVCSVAGNVATIQSAGICTLTADQAGNANYNAALQAAASVTINKANQTITGFAPATPITYSNGGIPLSASGGASGNAVTFTSTTVQVCTVEGNVVSVVAVGICTLKADQAGNANYNTAITVTATVVINKIAQSITGFSPASPISLAAGGTFTLSATGGASGNPVTFISSTTVVCTTGGINNATVTVVAVGVCTLTANQAGDATYSAASPVSATVLITILAAEGQIYYVHADHLGTPRAITKPSDNTVVWKWENSDPFGASQPNEDPASTGTVFKYNLRFPGQYYDQETGTHYNYFRDYDPSTGRYVQSDPIGLMGGVSTYGYVSNRPISALDPLGLCEVSQSPSKDCLNALLVAGADASALKRVEKDWETLKAASYRNGITPSLLASIAIRETGYRNIAEIGGGNGRGTFQIDIGKNPGVSARQAYDLSFAANFAANMLSTNMSVLAAKFPNFSSNELLQATAASYNFGRGNISGNPRLIDQGTTRNNYGQNVLDLLFNCFN